LLVQDKAAVAATAEAMTKQFLNIGFSTVTFLAGYFAL
jgi:hypothetical protein